jgi:uncharacterized protein with HEPN domain
MPHDPRKCLFDIIDAGKKIAEFTAGLCFEDFTHKALVKSAVHMQFIIIGEALMRIRSTDQAIYSRITDADRIIAFRNIIAHGYDVIVDDIVWEIIQEKIPPLLNEAQTLFHT